jgi:hypothetical protein
MQAGNIQPKVSFKMNYSPGSIPPFKASEGEFKLIVNPHQTKSISDFSNQYQPLDIKCKSSEINCSCVSDATPKMFDDLIDASGPSPALLWVDPRLLKTECLASLIENWKALSAAKNVALGIVVPEGYTEQKIDSSYETWKVNMFGISYVERPPVPIWYPSLARNSAALDNAKDELSPYDVFPLVEFPYPTLQWGEREITNHYHMLEATRARTRHFIYLNSAYPAQAFDQFYSTLQAIPKTGFYATYAPVVTPGGNAASFLTALIAGVLTESHFLTPKDEIPISSNARAQGVMILRKCF